MIGRKKKERMIVVDCNIRTFDFHDTSVPSFQGVRYGVDKLLAIHNIYERGVSCLIFLLQV